MNPEQTKEFAVRYYEWAKGDAVREIRERYMLLRSIRGVDAQVAAEYLESLSETVQLELMYALVRKKHELAADESGENPGSGDVHLIESYRTKTRSFRSEIADEYRTNIALSGKNKQKRIEEFLQIWQRLKIDPMALEEQRRRYEQMGRKGPDKKLLASIVKSRLTEVCGKIVAKDSSKIWTHGLMIGQTALFTEVDLGGSYQLRYSHYFGSSLDNLVNEFGIRGISIMEWMGLDGQTAWDLIYESEEEQAGSSVAQICSHFINAAPQLLKGL